MLGACYKENMKCARGPYSWDPFEASYLIEVEDEGAEEHLGFGQSSIDLANTGRECDT